MRKKVLLFYPILSEEYDYYSYPWLPMTILALGKRLEERGYPVLLIDERVQKDWKEVVDSNIKELLFVGVSSMSGRQIHYGLEFSRYVKSLDNIPVVWGGEHSTIFPEQVIQNPLVDYVVAGRGEEAIVSIAQALSNGEKPDKISYNSEATDLSIFFKMPIEKLRLEKYLNPETRRISLMSGVGCINNCSFCGMGKNRYISLSADESYEMMSYYINKFNVWGVRFFDPDFFASKGKVLGFCENILRHNLKIEWSAFGDLVSHTKYTRRDYELIRDSGFWRFHIGNESGSEKILRILNKPHTTNHMLEFLDIVKGLDVSISIAYMLGIPGETLDDLIASIEQMKKIRALYNNARFNINFLRPYPNTPLYELCVNEWGYAGPQNLEEWSADISRPPFPDFPWTRELFTEEYRRVFERDIQPLVHLEQKVEQE